MKCRNVCHWMTVIAGMFIGAGAGLQDYAQADTLHGQRAHWVMWVVLVNLRISD